MWFPDKKMKVNSFKQVAIPRNAEYFARYGLAVSPSSEYSGDEMVFEPKNKTEMLDDMARYDAMKQREELSNSKK